MARMVTVPDAEGDLPKQLADLRRSIRELGPALSLVITEQARRITALEARVAHLEQA